MKSFSRSLMDDPKAVLKKLQPLIKGNKKFIRRVDKKESKRIAEEEKQFASLHRQKQTGSKKSKAAGPKERRPKTVVANTPTGKETFTKAKARELVKAKKKIIKQPVSAVVKPKLETEGPAGQEDFHQLLLSNTIQGSDAVDPFAASSSMTSDFFTPTIQDQSEEEVLRKADNYFKDLNRKERLLNRAATLHMKRLKAINRKGGDKDGFRYVLPKNTKQLIHSMKSGEQETSVDPEVPLSSTFGSDTAKDEESDKPLRKSRRHGGTYSDFYQFQVSQRWTRNAERFLFRDRVDKSVFESKKRQRNIKNL